MRSFVPLAIATLAFQSSFPRTASTPLELTPEMAEVLSHMRIVELDEPGVGKVKVLRIGGVNVQILNENTASDFPPAGPYVKNGLGNLVLGWNMNTVYADRSGSHNLVLGHSNGYTGIGSIVSGNYNRAVGDASVVLGGSGNAAGYDSTVISAADSAAGNRSVVVGGSYNGAGTGGPDWPYSASIQGGVDVVIGRNYAFDVPSPTPGG